MIFLPALFDVKKSLEVHTALRELLEKRKREIPDASQDVVDLFDDFLNSLNKEKSIYLIPSLKVNYPEPD